jgi:hypothetical protein
MGGVPEPEKVWMVPLRRGAEPIEYEGVLSMTSDALVFEEEDGEVVRFPRSALRKVWRIRASPVLMIRWSEDDRSHDTAFYFAKPPPLGTSDPAAGAGATSGGRPLGAFGAFRRTSKRRQQRENVRYLSVSTEGRKETIQAWVSALRAEPEDGREED